MTQEFLDADELRTSVRDVLFQNDAAKTARPAKGSDSADNGRLWSTFSELGWLGLLIPEDLGGLGQRFSELAIVYEELGAVLAPDTFLASMLCAEGLLAAGAPDLQSKVLPHIASGEQRGWSHAPDMAPAVHATMKGKDISLKGNIRAAIGVDDSNFGLIYVRFEDGEDGYLFLEGSDAIKSRHIPTWDQSRRQYEVAVSGTVPGSALLCKGKKAEALRARLLAHMSIALACDSVGAADTILGKTIEYMKIRHQFGRAIASYQALKHRCADHKVEIEGARALAGVAARYFTDQHPEWQKYASSAKYRGALCAKNVGEDAIQLHGGIGFTWEVDCHLYLKRGRLNEMLCGDARWHKDFIAEWLKREVA